MLRVTTLAFMITILLVAGNVRSDEGITAKSPETSLWCVSNCGTCPSVCSPFAPPPKTSSISLPLAPERKSPPSPPPPPPPPPSISWTFSSSPYSSSGGGQERGGFSYPYYYFYSSDGLRASDLIPDFLWLFPLFLMLISIE